MTRINVYYLGHSAWVVESKNLYLFFDVQDDNIEEGGKLEDGLIDVSLLGDKPIYNFFSHNHHDHYSPDLHKYCETRKGTITILGNFTIQKTQQTLRLMERKIFEAGDITIYTAGSTDEGVCFLVQTDDACIFHAGDNADWGDGPQNKAYYDEIDYIAGLGKNIDIAFIPVCTFMGQRPSDMTKGAIYAIEKLAPAVTFPMHGNNREPLYGAFERDLRAAGSDAKLICARNVGNCHTI
jgi:L-ascorbate metabolism protein UlaG (beta-lactamase superfamily)